MFNIKQKEQEVRYEDFVPFIELLNDKKTLVTKNGYILQVVKIKGLDIACMEKIEKANIFNKRHNYFKKLKQEYTYSFYTVRGKNKDIREITKSDNKYINEINEKRKSLFEEAYENNSYVVISTNVEVSHIRERVLVSMVHEDQSLSNLLHNEVRKLTNEADNMALYFSDERAEVIDYDTGLMCFWENLINGGFFSKLHMNRPKRIGEYKFVGKYLTRVNYLVSTKCGLVKYLDRREMEDKKRFGIYVIIRNYPNQLDVRSYNKIFDLPMDIVFCGHVKSMDMTKMSAEFKKKQDLIKMFSVFSKSRREEIEELGERISKGEVSILEYMSCFRILGDTVEDLQINLSLFQAQLDKLGFDYMTSKDPDIFYSYFPERTDSLIALRGNLITSDNMAMLHNFESTSKGFERNSFGDQPVAYFNTRNDSLYAFNFHSGMSEGELGHTMIFGGSGMGKTTLISFLLMNCLRYHDMKILCFDSYNGMRIATESFGGIYIDPLYDEIRLNPFMLSNDPVNRKFLESWVSSLIASSDQEEKDLIGKVIGDLYAFEDLSLRSLEMLAEAVKSNKTIHNRLKRWLAKDDTTRGKLFNGKSDDLKYEKQIITFDMGHVIKDEELSNSLVSYIYHSFQRVVSENRSPHICFVDEMHKYLRNPLFTRNFTEASREWRKTEGIIIGAIQDVDTFLRHNNSDDILKNLATIIVFPDPSAKERDYIEGLGFNKQEYEWIRNASETREVMVKNMKTKWSVIINVDL